MSDGTPEPMPLDVARAIDAHYLDAQTAAEEHLAKVYEYHDRLAELGYSDAVIAQVGDDPAYGPWCGCDTCQVRETLHAALPHLEKAVLVEWGLSPRGKWRGD